MVAKNHCLMKLRHKDRYPVEINEQLLSAPEETENKSTHLQKEQTLTNMAWAMQQLNKEQQQCLTLFYLQKKSYQEITDETSYSLLQVKSYIQNGKRNLKIMLEKKGNSH